MHHIPPYISPLANPLYPLPADYASLTSDGQRLARVAASRQWLLPLQAFPGSTPDAQQHARLDACVASCYFFDTYYLTPDDDARFNPGFYESPPLPWAPFHFEMIRSWHAYRLNAEVCPRGSAKTRTCRKDMIHRLCTSPLYGLAYITSTNDNTKATAQAVKEQCYFNTRINDDFSPDYGGMRPSRGERSTGIELFYLENGSWLRSTSIKSRQRGIRPHRIRLDDPEYDETASTNMSQLRSDFSHTLFHVVIPMVLQSDTGCDWFGTFVSRRHYLWHAMLDNPDGSARQKEFRFWNRTIVRAETQGSPNESCWPEMWPLDEADRRARSLPSSRMTLFAIRELLGSAAYASEFLAAPGASDGAHFPDLNDPSSDAPFFFQLPPPGDLASPVTYTHKGAEITMPLSEFLQKTRVFLTVDAAFTEKATSDYKAVACLAYLPTDNLLFVLDLWAGKKKDSVFIREIFSMADRWRAPLIFVEVVRQSKNLYDALVNFTNIRATDVFGHAHCPAIRDVRVGLDSKGQRICGSLDLRFEHALIKFPPALRSHRPPWSLLAEQLEGFNPEAPDLGLTNDDCLDCIALSSYAIKGRRSAFLPDSSTPVTSFDPIDTFLHDRPLPPSLQKLGITARSMIDFSRCTPEQLAAILSKSETPSSSHSKA